MSQIKTVRFIDSNGRAFGIRLDSATAVAAGINFAHNKIHDGESYCACMHEIDFDKASEIGVLFTTPNTLKRLHAIVLVYAGASALFQLCEAPTVDVANYPITFSPPSNRDRNSSNTSGVWDVRATPVQGSFSRKRKADAAAPITADGTVLHSEMLGSGKQGGGGGNRDESEFILRQNTTYYFRLQGTANGADNSVASMVVVWYEHENLE